MLPQILGKRISYQLMKPPGMYKLGDLRIFFFLMTSDVTSTISHLTLFDFFQ